MLYVKKKGLIYLIFFEKIGYGDVVSPVSPRNSGIKFSDVYRTFPEDSATVNILPTHSLTFTEWGAEAYF